MTRVTRTRSITRSQQNATPDIKKAKELSSSDFLKNSLPIANRNSLPGQQDDIYVHDVTD